VVFIGSVVNRSSKVNLIYAAFFGLALLLLAPYFGLGAFLGGRNREQPPPPAARKRAADQDFSELTRKRVNEETRKGQKSSVSPDSALSDIEAMLGDKPHSGAESDDR
jgi:hypothetical protein